MEGKSQYNFQVPADFNNNYSNNNFSKDIKNSSALSSKLYAIYHTDIYIKVVFNTELTSEELAILTSLISGHDSAETTVEAPNILETPFATTAFDTANYALVGTFKYPALIISSVSHIQIISSMDSTVTNYTVRIKNQGTNATIAEQTFTNTTDAINNFSTFSNLPTSNAIFEVHIKRSANGTGKFAYIKSLIIHYN